MARVPDSRLYVAGVLPAVLVLALGLATTVAPLTATALNSVSESRAGLASAVNNDVARIGGLVAVAVLPALGGITGLSYLHPAALAHGFQRAVLIAAALCALGRSDCRRRDPEPAGRRRRAAGSPAEALSHCALEATPLAAGVQAAAPPAGPGEGLTSIPDSRGMRATIAADTVRFGILGRPASHRPPCIRPARPTPRRASTPSPPATPCGRRPSPSATGSDGWSTPTGPWWTIPTSTPCTSPSRTASTPNGHVRPSSRREARPVREAVHRQCR